MTNETTTKADDSRSQTPVTIITNSAKFSLGQVVATPGALALLEATGHSGACLLARHLHGDWGDICWDDAAMNEQAITDGSRIMSVYRLVDAERLKATPKQRHPDLPTIWIITDGTNGAGQREATTFLLPEDY
jgi:hypothetical protein